MDGPVELAIVVVSYNVRELTIGCVASVLEALAHDELGSRIWVVDNASADGSAAAVQGRFPRVTVIASGRNLGFAGGANLGLQAVAALEPMPPFVLILNPDTILAPGSLGPMVRHLREHPRVGMVGAQLSYADGSFQHGAFHFPTLAMLALDLWPLNHRLMDSSLNGRYPRRLYATGQPFPIDHPLGAAMMVRSATVDEVGPLDTSYFMYCEEIDWCLRIRRAGWEICCVPRARITHLGGQSVAQFREAMFVALWRSRMLLFSRYYSRSYQFVARRLIRAGLRKDRRRVLQQARRGALAPDEAERRLTAFGQVMEMLACPP